MHCMWGWSRGADAHTAHPPCARLALAGDGAAKFQEKTGQHDYKVGKKERSALKAAKSTGGPTGSLWTVCVALLVGSMLLAGFVYYMATLELDGEEVEIEEKE